MKNEQFVFGKNLSPERKAGITENINKIKELAKQRMDGEYDKTQEELKFIEMSNEYIKEELRTLGINDVDSLKTEQFHLVDEEAYEKLDAKESFVAFIAPMESAAYINKDTMRHRLELYKTILHEAVHIFSLEKNQVVERDEEAYISNYRTGYTNVAGIHEDKHEHFRGFNEAVTDLIAVDILRKHEDEIRSSLKLRPEEEQLPVPSESYVELLIAIMHKIAEKQNERYADVWKRFKKGYFTGDMMHLRDIERTFGKGALRFLAAIDSGTIDMDFETYKKAIRFFETDNEEEQKQIAQEVLNEREKSAYDKRKT